MTYWKDGEKTEAKSMLLSFNKIWGGGTEVNNDLFQSLSKLAKHSKMFTNGLGKAEDGKARCHDRISNNDGKPTFSPTIAHITGRPKTATRVLSASLRSEPQDCRDSPFAPTAEIET